MYVWIATGARSPNSQERPSCTNLLKARPIPRRLQDVPSLKSNVLPAASASASVQVDACLRRKEGRGSCEVVETTGGRGCFGWKRMLVLTGNRAREVLRRVLEGARHTSRKSFSSRARLAAPSRRRAAVPPRRPLSPTSAGESYLERTALFVRIHESILQRRKSVAWSKAGAPFAENAFRTCFDVVLPLSAKWNTTALW